MKELITFLAQSLVEEPEAVEVSVQESYRSTVIRLHVAQGDMGRVIGKSGRVANAMRDLIQAAGAGSEKEIILKIG